MEDKELIEFEARLAEETARLARDQALKRKAFMEARERKAQEAPKEPEAPKPQPKQEGCGGPGSKACATCVNKDKCGKPSAEQLQLKADISFRMQFVKHRVLVLSGKGGVGKSMMSAQLAFGLARRDRSVGLLDIDICGPTVPKMLGLRGADVMRGASGLEPVRVSNNLCAMSIGFVVDDDTAAVIWRGPRKTGLIQTFLRDVDWGVLDYIIVDTPPGTSDEHLGIVQMLKDACVIDGALIVTSPQDVACVEVGKEIDFCKRMGIPVLGVVENFGNFICPCCKTSTAVWPSTSGGGRGLAAAHNCPFLGGIPLDPALSRAGEIGEEVDVETATGKAIETIVDKIIEAVEKQ